MILFTLLLIYKKNMSDVTTKVKADINDKLELMKLR